MTWLKRLGEVIATHRPPMLIEVDRENYDAFDAWIAETGYAVLERHQRYPTNTNYLVAPLGA